MQWFEEIWNKPWVFWSLKDVFILTWILIILVIFWILIHKK